mmetsp:Transcript_1765/g.5293  ORF Transcript_1765/g.5293 Transcript_1765/m.5293 type:complete len:311 (-) Transcript_1765:407-1339(-)|eukprot:CAMPEP_0168426128 /NCGR_PEP_ID=MMETSP0228-20121227/35674_1 /TAXON_ID=133427 /ORGANISM="Protoceratium reticulatum, Strain CCCM 535 (=CCMP 1889)" /LENGTH=310 /DNA_ID=CAMNT_0008440131 /DNA_START=88 /DNA_END=1020 /DNA_ORIENTATION=-
MARRAIKELYNEIGILKQVIRLLKGQPKAEFPAAPPRVLQLELMLPELPRGRRLNAEAATFWPCLRGPPEARDETAASLAHATDEQIGAPHAQSGQQERCPSYMERDANIATSERAEDDIPAHAEESDHSDHFRDGSMQDETQRLDAPALAQRRLQLLPSVATWSVPTAHFRILASPTSVSTSVTSATSATSYIQTCPGNDARVSAPGAAKDEVALLQEAEQELISKTLAYDYLAAFDILEAFPTLRETWSTPAKMMDRLEAAVIQSCKSLRPQAVRKLRTWETLCKAMDTGDRTRLRVLQNVWTQLLSN